MAPSHAGASPVSIIVPLAGGAPQALRCFEGLAAQAEAIEHEVLIVDDHTVGLESLLARLDGDLTVLRTPRRLGFAGAGAFALEHAGGEIIVLVRGAAAPAPGWLEALVRGLEDPAVGLAASVSPDARSTSPVCAWALAVRAVDLRAVGLPAETDELTFAALALRVAARGHGIVSVGESVIWPPSSRSIGARRAPGQATELTVVIPTLDAASERLRACVAAVQANTDTAHEIVIVDNGSPPQGFAAPVNAGLRAARTPYVVVMNDDVEALPGWWPPLRDALQAGAAVAFPFTVDSAMRSDFAAWCFALGHEALRDFSHAPGEFFDPDLVIWFQDTDLLYRLREAGRPPVLVESSRIRHGQSETVASDDPELSAWIRRQVMVDQQRFMAKHPDAQLAGGVVLVS